MAEKTGISWTDATWNPIRGCSKVSAGCKNCYAEKVAARFSGPGQPYEGTVRDGHWNGQIRLVPEKLSEPMHWKRARRIFVNSMSDMFHDDVPFEFIAAVFGVMAACPQHTFQVLTKRPARAVAFFAWAQGNNHSHPETICLHYSRAYTAAPANGVYRWPLPNVHLGVSVENQETADDRIPLLLQCPAAVHFVSYEPALGPVSFPFKPHACPECGCKTVRGINELGKGFRQCDACGQDWWTDITYASRMAHGIDWIIVGGESGPNARPFDVAWARSTIEQCRAAGVACFVKQVGAHPWDGPGSLWGADPTMRSGVIRLSDRAGADPSEWPDDLRVQEFPESAR